MNRTVALGILPALGVGLYTGSLWRESLWIPILGIVLLFVYATWFEKAKKDPVLAVQLERTWKFFFSEMLLSALIVYILWAFVFGSVQEGILYASHVLLALCPAPLFFIEPLIRRTKAPIEQGAVVQKGIAFVIMYQLLGGILSAVGFGSTSVLLFVFLLSSLTLVTLIKPVWRIRGS
ncbi:hypothetical protein KBA73_03495 [Patescibacteria group bacterium]|nr:hypothetical protein [Patescibacteria group bacterium]